MPLRKSLSSSDGFSIDDSDKNFSFAIKSFSLLLMSIFARMEKRLPCTFAPGPRPSKQIRAGTKNLFYLFFVFADSDEAVTAKNEYQKFLSHNFL